MYVSYQDHQSTEDKLNYGAKEASQTGEGGRAMVVEGDSVVTTGNLYVT